MFDKGRCDNGFIWNPSICECEYDKSCDVGEYFDCKNCKCRKKLIDELAEECSEDIDGIDENIMLLQIIMEKYATLIHCT